MTIYKSWAVGGTLILATLLAGFIMLGWQRPAHAQSAGTIVNGVFCFLNQFPTTNVFSGNPCGSPAAASSTLTIIKTVSGTSTPASDFNIEVTGSNGVIANDPGNSSGTTYLGVDPGTYTVSEAVNATGLAAGVSLSSFTAAFSGDCNSSGSISLTAGGSSGCTITNTYTPPAPTTGTLVVKKVVVNAGGGVATPDQFSFSINGGASTAFNSNGENDFSNEVTGTYSVVETTASSSYTTTYSNGNGGDCSNLTVAAGATTTCTVTNTFVPPTPASCTIVSDTKTTDTTDSHAAILVDPLNSSWTATSTASYDPSAAWIWSENPAINTDVNVTKVFTRTFNVVGAPVSGSVDIAADNGFVLKVNGTTVEDASTTEDNFSKSKHFDISSDLVSGNNTVEVDVTNFGVAGSNGSNNPGGVIFQVNLPSNSCGSVTPPPANGTLEVKKVLVGAPAGTTPDDFSFQVKEGSGSLGSQLPFDPSGTSVMGVAPDTYTVREVASTTYTTTYSNSENANADCNSLDVTSGHTTTCTITNTFNSNNGGGGGNPTNVKQTIVVKPQNMTTNPFTDQWFFYNDQTNTLDNTLGAFVDGPATAPIGAGSAQISATTTQGILFANLSYIGLPLSDITSLSYATYRSAGASALALALQFDINPNITVATTSYDGRLVYEPYYTHTVNDNTWQTWNTMDNASSSGIGNWWFSKGWIATETGCSQATPCTWSQVLTKLPNIGISGITGFKAGSNWSSAFTGNVDDFVIATTDGTNSTSTTYDFDPAVSKIGLTKTVDNSTPNTGATVTYTITAGDTGDDATGVVVQDILPSGLTFVSTSSSDTIGVYDPVSGNWTIGALSSTTPATLHIMATVNKADSNGSVIANTVSVTAGDTSGTSNTASASLTVTIPNNIPNVPGGGGGGGGNGPIPGSFGGGPAGQVLGASTSTAPLSSCTQYLTAFIRLGGNNDSSQVTRLQQFLNQFEGDKLAVNGIYDQATYQAVKAFQQKYAADILTPWGEDAPTGFVYLTTRREVNIIYCNYALQFPLTAAEQAEIQAYKDGSVGGSGGTQNTPNQTQTQTKTGTNKPTSEPQSGSTTPTTENNPNLGEVGAAEVSQGSSSIWSKIGSFFAHLFGR